MNPELKSLINQIGKRPGATTFRWPVMSALLKGHPGGMAAEKVLERLTGAGHEALLVGGCVRDSLLGVTPREFDIATSARPAQVEALFEKTVPVGRRFGVIIVVLDGVRFEVATFRSDLSYVDGRRPEKIRFSSLQEDARRRDFTINTLYFDGRSEQVIDFFGGIGDLADGVIRAIGHPEERFSEDYLRMMRAVRFAARFDYDIEPQTGAAISKLAHNILKISAERIQDELRRTLTDDNPAVALRLFDELGLLKEILPEVEDMKGCAQPANYHPEGDVFVHSLLTVEKLGPRPAFELALAALLHDVGKPEASRRAGEMKFPEHERIGRDMTIDICRRLKLSNEETDRILWLVKRHMYFKDAKKMKESKLKRLIFHPDFEMLAELHRADAEASWGVLDDYNFVVNFRDNLPPEKKAPARLLNGNDLISEGYTPGAPFKTILEQVEDAQLEGAVTTREEALELARVIAGRLGLQRPSGDDDGAAAGQ